MEGNEQMKKKKVILLAVTTLFSWENTSGARAKSKPEDLFSWCTLLHTHNINILELRFCVLKKSKHIFKSAITEMPVPLDHKATTIFYVAFFTKLGSLHDGFSPPKLITLITGCDYLDI